MAFAALSGESSEVESLFVDSSGSATAAAAVRCWERDLTRSTRAFAALSGVSSDGELLV